MIKVHENIARLDIDNTSSNKDKEAWNKVNQDSLSDKAERMETTTPPLSFQSISNPKVNVTIEFADPDVSIRAEKDLNNIFKEILLEKYKNRGFQTGESALGCSPLNN